MPFIPSITTVGRIKDMPYIKESRRKDLVGNPDLVPMTAGELNFKITMLLVQYLDKYGKSYEVFNDIMGAMTGAQLEFYNRVITPYEDKKCKENGDVY